jgi:hypothetical protein
MLAKREVIGKANYKDSKKRGLLSYSCSTTAERYGLLSYSSSMTAERNGLLSYYFSMTAEGNGLLSVLLHNIDAHNVNVTGRVCYLT